ncbi:AraC family transcriptional regulator [Nocardioides marmoriginsengisoli]|nr:AraC family transcriptional regulator [Nocardioides marmoriginsengisoli]
MASLIRGTVLLNFVSLVNTLGGDAEAMLHARGIDPSATTDHERFLSSTAAAAVIADAADELECSDFGMRLAREQGIQILGPVAVIIRNSETVASALESVSRFLHNIAPVDRVELVRGPRSAVFTLTTTVRQPARHDQWIEHGLGIAMDAFRLMVGDGFVPLRVTMQHPRISPIAAYKDMFGCPVTFESDLNSVHLPNHVLNEPIRGRDAEAFVLAERYLSEIRPDLEIVDHVRELTQRLLAVNQASLLVTARAMAIHPRVLQRKLAEAGSSFEDVLDDVRRGLAWQLSATGMPISRIASSLGYAEHSSYTRACRRWYGESPRQLRARRRQNEPSA